MDGLLSPRGHMTPLPPSSSGGGELVSLQCWQQGGPSGAQSVQAGVVLLKNSLGASDWGILGKATVNAQVQDALWTQPQLLCYVRKVSGFVGHSHLRGILSSWWCQCCGFGPW